MDDVSFTLHAERTAWIPTSIAPGGWPRLFAQVFGYGVAVGVPAYFASMERRTSNNPLPWLRIAI